MPRLSLRAKLLASFIIILIPVLSLLLYNYREAYEGRPQTILDDQMQTAQALAVVVDASFDEAAALGWALSNDPLVYTFDPSVLDPHLQQLGSRMPSYEAIGVLNAAGDNVGASAAFPPDTRRERIASDRPYFREVMATRQPAVSEVLISRRTFQPTIVVAVPIVEADRSVGAIIVTLLLDALREKLEVVTLRPEQHIILVDEAATIAFHSGLADLPWEQRNLGDFEPVRDALRGEPVEVRRFTSPLLGDNRIGAFTPTPKYGWVVGVTLPEDVALAPIRTVLVNQLLAFAAVALLSLGLVFILSYSLLRPVNGLTKHALALARGHLGQRVYVRTGDELEGLAQTFNYMAEQLQKREEENAMLSRLKDEFLSVAAHELKTPVTSIKGYAQLVLRREREGISPRGLKALEAINRGSDRISRLVNELLEISRIHVGRLQFQPTRFDLSQLVAEVVDRVNLTTEKHRLLFRSTGPVYIDADRDRIEQVLDNLLDNAIKFSPQGGDIETKAQVIDGEAIVSVRDYGVGISKEKRSVVFELFTRAHVGTPYDYGGMGVGLYISREIVQRHGGRIWFDSEEGKGSTFFFALPLAPLQGEMEKR